jgi:hypothetical protein
MNVSFNTAVCYKFLTAKPQSQKVLNTPIIGKQAAVFSRKMSGNEHTCCPRSL